MRFINLNYGDFFTCALYDATAIYVKCMEPTGRTAMNLTTGEVEDFGGKVVVEELYSFGSFVKMVFPQE